MKRFLAFALLATFVLGVPLSHFAFSDATPKVSICHVPDSHATTIDDKTFFVGQVVEVPSNALEPHCTDGADPLHPRPAHHDCTEYDSPDGSTCFCATQAFEPGDVCAQFRSLP